MGFCLWDLTFRGKLNQLEKKCRRIETLSSGHYPFAVSICEQDFFFVCLLLLFSRRG